MTVDIKFLFEMWLAQTPGDIARVHGGPHALLRIQAYVRLADVVPLAPAAPADPAAAPAAVLRG